MDRKELEELLRVCEKKGISIDPVCLREVLKELKELE